MLRRTRGIACDACPALLLGAAATTGSQHGDETLDRGVIPSPATIGGLAGSATTWRCSDKCAVTRDTPPLSPEMTWVSPTVLLPSCPALCDVAGGAAIGHGLRRTRLPSEVDVYRGLLLFRLGELFGNLGASASTASGAMTAAVSPTVSC